MPAEWLGKEFVDISAFDTYQPAQLDFRVYAIGDDATIRELAGAYPSTETLDADQFLHQATGELDMMLGVIYALLALAVIIALLGIANTMALSIFERTRELGLLRAVGMIRSQLRTTIRWEAIMIALFGTTLGLAVGSFFGWASVRALNSGRNRSVHLPDRQHRGDHRHRLRRRCNRGDCAGSPSRPARRAQRLVGRVGRQHHRCPDRRAAEPPPGPAARRAHRGLRVACPRQGSTFEVTAEPSRMRATSSRDETPNLLKMLRM